MSRMNRWQITKIAIKKDSKRLQDTPPKKIPTSQFLMLFMDTILLACLRWQLEKKHDELHELIISTGSTVDRKKRLHQLRLRLVVYPHYLQGFCTSPGGCLRFLPSTVGVFMVASTYVGSNPPDASHQQEYPPDLPPDPGTAGTTCRHPTHLRGPCVAFTLLMKPLCLRSAALPRLPRAWVYDKGVTPPPWSGVTVEEPSKTPNC